MTTSIPCLCSTERVSTVLTGSPFWSLTADVELKDGDGGLVARTRWGDVRIEDRGATVHEALERMTMGPVRLENVSGLRRAYGSWRSGAQETCAEWQQLRLVMDLLAGCVIASLDLPSFDSS